jgi:hypothetical protein
MVGLTTAMASQLRSRGIWREAGARHAAAAEAALALGDQIGQANALTNLGDARWLTCDHQGAIGGLRQALCVYRDHDEWLGQANALNGLSAVWRQSGHHPNAAEAAN